MASDAKGSRSADHWQRKFYDSLEELEEKEKEWQALEILLRKLSSRLSLAVFSNDKKLEKLLESLRTALRDEHNPYRIKKIIDDVIAGLVKIENSGSEATTSPGINAYLLQLLEQLSIPDTFQRQTRYIEKKLRKTLTPPENEAVIRDIVELIGLYVDNIENAKSERESEEQASGAITETRSEAIETDSLPGDKSPGFLAGLFKSRHEEADKPGEPQPETPQSKSEATNLDIDSVNTVVEVGDEARTLAAETLIRLLEKLSFPDDLHFEAELVRRKLEPCQSNEQLAEGLEAIADIVARMHQRTQNEKKELEDFLRQLTGRLHELDKDIRESVRIRKLSEKAGQDINDAVKDEVDEIEKNLQEKLDLDGLKTAVQSRVIIIRDHMDRFLQEEASRHDASYHVVKRLSSQLEHTRNEVEDLRKQVVEAKQAALLDQLTGIPNRLAYDQYMTEELARFNRYGSVFSLMVWDVDKFKGVNDQYGHAAGDKVLTVVAQLMEKNIRETDRIARYGGEEFVVLLTETGVQQARSLAEKLRQAIENTAFHFRGSRVVITASCGVAEIRKDETDEELFKRADAALYQAKENGRNRYEIAD